MKLSRFAFLIVLVLSTIAHAAPSPVPLDRARWMEQLSDQLGQRKLSEFCLPGTHDSATMGIKSNAEWSVNTRKTITEQLGDGIRVFDVRACPSGDKFYACHPSVTGDKLGKRLDEVLGEFGAFLERTKGEILVVSLRSEETQGNWNSLLQEVAKSRLNLSTYAYKVQRDGEKKILNNPWTQTYDSIVGPKGQRQSRIILTIWPDRPDLDTFWHTGYTGDEAKHSWAQIVSFYSNTNDWEQMIRKQQALYRSARDTPPPRPFALSLFLTPSWTDVMPWGPSELEHLYKDPSCTGCRRLGDKKIYEVVRGNFPRRDISVIYTDFYEDTALVDFALDCTMGTETARSINLAGHTSLSTPFVAGGVVFFQGTDNKLWRVNIDGSDSRPLHYESRSAPFVQDGYVYFQGKGNKLWRIKSDGTGGTQLGNHTTLSTPFVAEGVVFFQGTDNKLWRVNIDGSDSRVLHDESRSAPFVQDGHVYFQGKGNKLWRVKSDGTGGTQLGNHTTLSTPFVAGGVVFFQGTDNKLWRVNTDGSDSRALHYASRSAPFVQGDSVYFQGTDDKLWRIKSDGNGGENLRFHLTTSSPFVTADGTVYIRGRNDRMWQIKPD